MTLALESVIIRNSVTMVRNSVPASRKTTQKEPESAPETTQTKTTSSREIINAVSLWVSMLENIWHQRDKLLENGIESRKMALLIKEDLDTASLIVESIVWVRMLLGSLTQVEREELDTYGQQAEKVKNDFHGLLRLAENPPPHFDLTTLDLAAAGPSESLDNILARLKAEGDL